MTRVAIASLVWLSLAACTPLRPLSERRDAARDSSVDAAAARDAELDALDLDALLAADADAAPPDLAAPAQDAALDATAADAGPTLPAPLYFAIRDAAPFRVFGDLVDDGFELDGNLIEECPSAPGELRGARPARPRVDAAFNTVSSLSFLSSRSLLVRGPSGLVIGMLPDAPGQVRLQLYRATPTGGGEFQRAPDNGIADGAPVELEPIGTAGTATWTGELARGATTGAWELTLASSPRGSAPLTFSDALPTQLELDLRTTTISLGGVLDLETLRRALAGLDGVLGTADDRVLGGSFDAAAYHAALVAAADIRLPARTTCEYVSIALRVDGVRVAPTRIR